MVMECIVNGSIVNKGIVKSVLILASNGTLLWTYLFVPDLYGFLMRDHLETKSGPLYTRSWGGGPGYHLLAGPKVDMTKQLEVESTLTVHLERFEYHIWGSSTVSLLITGIWILRLPKFPGGWCQMDGGLLEYGWP
ncbi:hypothetical protein G9A89_000446 [Geosiphon pyriformis]|nr:hypothetical protein G9A89_000446 [Geosiphon pyriformis]